MTGTTIGCWIIINLFISFWCYVVLCYSNDTLFTYLGEAEITPGHWEECYGYDTLTIPARIVAFGLGVAAVAVFVGAWAAFIGVVFFWG